MSSLYYHIFVALGLVVAYEDWSYRRIRNHWIFLGLAVCAAGFCYLLWNTLLGHQGAHLGRIGEYYYPWKYYPKVLVHLLLSLVSAIVLWRMSIWPAGDAKLYILFAFFAVLIDPNLPGFPLLLFMLLLVNIFVPAGMLFAAETMALAARRLRAPWRIDWGNWIKANIEVLEIRLREAWPFRLQYLTMLINLFAMFYLMQAGQMRFQRFSIGPFGNLVVFLLMFVAWGRLSMVLRSHKVGAAALASLAAVMLAGALFRGWDIVEMSVVTLKMVFSFGVFLSFARLVFYWLIERESLRELKVEDLGPGVILSDKTWEALSSEPDLAGKFGDRYSDGLSAEDVEVLKAWLAGRGAQTYTVYHTIPFAVWIFLGTLFTISLRVNMVSLLIPYYDRAMGLLKAVLSGRWS